VDLGKGRSGRRHRLWRSTLAPVTKKCSCPRALLCRVGVGNTDVGVILEREDHSSPSQKSHDASHSPIQTSTISNMSRFRAEADMADHRMMNKLPAMIAAISSSPAFSEVFERR
jgi:hypothetical protein